MLCRCFSMNCFAFAFLLLATQFLSLSFLFFAVASPCPALPLLIKATPCIHSLCCAAHIGSMQFHCSSEPCFAMPLRHVSKPCHGHAVISNSELCRCGANHVVSMQFHCVSVQSFALPLIRGQSHTLPLLRLSLKSCAFALSSGFRKKSAPCRSLSPSQFYCKKS